MDLECVSSRYVHGVRDMRLRLVFGLAIHVNSGLAFHFSRYLEDFRFMRFRPVRLEIGLEFVECLMSFALVSSARSLARRWGFPDDLGQIYNMILTFSLKAESSRHSRHFFETRILFETFAKSGPRVLMSDGECLESFVGRR